MKPAEILDERRLACANIGVSARFPVFRRAMRARAKEAGVLFMIDAAIASRAVSRRPRLRQCAVTTR